MSLGSILSSLTGTSSHAAFSAQSATSTASEELQKLFSKLHMDAIASTATPASSTAASTSSTASTTSSSGGLLGEITHGLRHVLDTGITAAREGRTAIKTATSAYAHGGSLGTLATQVIDKLG